MFDQKYMLGIPELDVQHKAIFAAARSLRDLIVKPGQGHLIHSALTGLREMLVVHFAEEEAFMTVIKCAELDKHKESHVGILQLIDDCIDRLSSHSNGREEFGQMIGDEVVGHIEDFDIRIADTVKRLIDGLVNHEDIVGSSQR